MSPRILAAALAAAAALQPATAATPAYNVTALPQFANTTQYSLNRWGQAIGVSGATTAPLLWTPSVANGASGTVLDLSKQPGYPGNLNPGLKGIPTAINDRGQIVGNANAISGGDGNGTISWLWTPETLNSTTGVLHGAKGSVTAFAAFSTSSGTAAEYPAWINNLGQITGHGAYYNPVVFNPSTANSGTGTWTADTSVGVGWAFFVNDAGQFAGSAYGGTLPTDGPYYPFLQTGFNGFQTGGVISSPSWSANATVQGLNQLGDVIVDAVPAGGSEIHGFLYKNGVATDVGNNAETFVNAINDSDMIVGNYIPAGGALPFINTGGTVFELSTLVPATVDGAPFTVLASGGASAINDKGQIIISGTAAAGEAVFILTPAAMIIGKQPKITLGAIHTVSGGYTRKVTIKNTTGNTLTGPVSVVLDNLNSNVVLTSRNGNTAFAGPAGSPYQTVSTANMAKNAAASATLTFIALNPAAITFTTRALAGPATP